MARVMYDMPTRQYRRFNDFVRGELRRKKIKQENLAEYLKITRTALTLKLNGTNSWSLEQALNAIEFLDGDVAEIFK